MVLPAVPMANDKGRVCLVWDVTKNDLVAMVPLPRKLSVLFFPVLSVCNNTQLNQLYTCLSGTDRCKKDDRTS